jgi:hypothetical protein
MYRHCKLWDRVSRQTCCAARRIVWFEQPAQARRRYVSDYDFRAALDQAPPGIIDPRSWAYWNNVMGRYPAPPMPKRKLG